MSPAQVERLYRETSHLAENAPEGSSLQVRSAVEAALLKRIINGGRA